MIEISVIFLSLLIEAYVILLFAALTWLYFASRKKKNDRQAALKLVEQIKHQSDTRLTATGSYLEEKYQFEGQQLAKAVKSIDKAEKSFFQKVIDMYLKRDAEAFGKLDAFVAEMIAAYKELTPAIRVEKSDNNDAEKDAEIARLKEENEQLTEQLAITNKTMSDMIAEFGNMFGGGKDNELEQNEVVNKLIKKHQQADSADVDPDLERAETAEAEEVEEANTAMLDMDDIAIEGVDLEGGAVQVSQQEADPETEAEVDEEVASDADIDDILNGIISSGPEKK